MFSRLTQNIDNSLQTLEYHFDVCIGLVLINHNFSRDVKSHSTQFLAKAKQKFDEYGIMTLPERWRKQTKPENT